MAGREVSLAFQTDKRLSTYGSLARVVEEYGFDCVSVYNDLYYQPAWPALFEMARATKRIRLGPAAVNPFITHPIAIAGNVALLDEVSRGRAYLGMSRGAWLDSLGLKPHRPISALAEALGLVRHFLERKRHPYTGESFTLHEPQVLRWKVPRPNVPFLLGAWGRKTVQACAHLVQEIKVGGTANPAVAQLVKSRLEAFREKWTPDSPLPRLVVGAVAVVSDDSAAARELARRQVGLYLPIVARLDETLEADPDWLAQVERAVAEERPEDLGRLVSDEQLALFTFAGTPADVIEQAEALYSAGVDRIEFGTPHGLSSESGLQLLGEQVLPELRCKE